MVHRLLFVAFVLVASSVSAQTVEQQVDLLALGYGVGTAVEVEADGDPSTMEWLFQRSTVVCVDNDSCGYVPGGVYRVVVLTLDGVCAGDWFTASPDAHLIRDVDGRDKLIVHHPASYPPTEAIRSKLALNRPEC